MIVETKYQKGQDLFFLDDNKIKKKEVRRIETRTWGNDVQINYFFSISLNGECKKPEEEVFETIDELLQYFTQQYTSEAEAMNRYYESRKEKTT